jgi:hypothetical protein
VWDRQVVSSEKREIHEKVCSERDHFNDMKISKWISKERDRVGVDWTHTAQRIEQWKALVNAGMNL